MNNYQIDITNNGTTTLATAGKYCDRNIDVNVDVAEQPTQFTNLLETGEVLLNHTVDSVGGVSATLGAFVLGFENPDTSGNTAIELHFRGLTYSRSFYYAKSSDSIKWSLWGQYSTGTAQMQKLDEFGDAIIVFPATTFRYIRTTFFGMPYTYYEELTDSSLKGRIVTLNEPIGNGGYVG